MVVLKVYKGLLICLLTFLMMSCERVFEFSPYVAIVKEEYKNTTTKNLQLLNNIQLSSDTFSFAFVTDTHHDYDNLKVVCNNINSRDDVKFVIVGGDIANQGLLREFELFYDAVDKLNKPYLTVIGNHDYRSNGESVYKEMYGDFNYSFQWNGFKFILFDDVVWESNQNPDLDWLATQLADHELYKQVFVIAHIPPFVDLTAEMEERYKNLMFENDVKLSIHGHIHDFTISEVYQDGVTYLTGNSLSHPEYCIVHVQNEDFNIEIIRL